MLLSASFVLIAWSRFYELTGMVSFTSHCYHVLALYALVQESGLIAMLGYM